MTVNPVEDTRPIAEAEGRLDALLAEMGAGRVVLTDGDKEVGAIVSPQDLELLRLVERYVSHEIASEMLSKYGLDTDEDGDEARWAPPTPRSFR